MKLLQQYALTIYMCVSMRKANFNNGKLGKSSINKTNVVKQNK